MIIKVAFIYIAISNQKDYEWFIEKGLNDAVESFRPIIDLISIEEKKSSDKLKDNDVIDIFKKIIMKEKDEKRVKLLKNYSRALTGCVDFTGGI